MMREPRPAPISVRLAPPGARRPPTGGDARVRRIRRVALLGAAMAALAGAGAASACIEVGVYRDRPQSSIGQLDKLVGPGI